MKEEAAAEKERKRTITKERQQKQAEKLRLEEMAKRVSIAVPPFATTELIPCILSLDGRQEASKVRFRAPKTPLVGHCRADFDPADHTGWPSVSAGPRRLLTDSGRARERDLVSFCCKLWGVSGSSQATAESWEGHTQNSTDAASSSFDMLAALCISWASWGGFRSLRRWLLRRD